MNLPALLGVPTSSVTQAFQPVTTIGTGAMVLLVVAVGLALAFEFVNGFHDTANAVATVIYTNTLRPWVAVIWSGLWNLTGVLLSNGAVAYGVLALLPVDMVLNSGSSAGFAMVFALLLSAIIWNLGTWYMGLPASSTHSLFGAIIGVGIANALFTGHSVGDGVNWLKLKETMMALLISPVIGFVFAGLLLILSKVLIRWPALYKEPEKGKAPPLAVRSLLVLTCTGVSYGHGSNDGQKGMGLLLLILIGILPGRYALNTHLTDQQLQAIHANAVQIESQLAATSPMVISSTDAGDVLSAYIKSSGSVSAKTVPALAAVNHQIASTLDGKHSIAELSTSDRTALRTEMYEASAATTKLMADKKITDAALVKFIKQEKTGYIASMNAATQYLPAGVQLATALALGLGTMIGWKRIVVTVGEKIGKTHLSYGQGAAAELVAAVTIQLATAYKLPVSTTHVLSSGVAGTMAANRSGLQTATLRNLVLAWVLTLPMCVLLGAGLFSAALFAVIHNQVPSAFAVLLLLTIAIAIWRFTSPKSKKSSKPESPTTMRADAVAST